MRLPKTNRFTLIELLVVVAIIAILASMLLPALTKAREMGRRAACIGNLRDLALTYTFYAEEYDGKLPLFFHNSKQMNHFIWHGGVSGNPTYQPHWLFQGVLYSEGVLGDIRQLYCPSESDESRRFNTASNPWPKIDFTNTLSSYGNRPVTCQLAGNFFWPDPMPRLRDLDDKALISDYTGIASALATRHRDGVNVAYADGAVIWVSRRTFGNFIDQSISIDWNYGNGAVERLQDDIFKVFDGHH